MVLPPRLLILQRPFAELAEVVSHSIQYIQSVSFGRRIHRGIAVGHTPGGVDIVMRWADLNTAGVGGKIQPAEAAGGLTGPDVLQAVEEPIGGQSPAGALHPVENEHFGVDDGPEVLVFEVIAYLFVELNHVFQMGGLFFAHGPLARVREETIDEVCGGLLSSVWREGVWHWCAGGDEFECYVGGEELWPRFPGLDD